MSVCMYACQNVVIRKMSCIACGQKLVRTRGIGMWFTSNVSNNGLRERCPHVFFIKIVRTSNVPSTLPKAARAKKKYSEDVHLLSLLQERGLLEVINLFSTTSASTPPFSFLSSLFPCNMFEFMKNTEDHEMHPRLISCCIVPKPKNGQKVRQIEGRRQIQLLRQEMLDVNLRTLKRERDGNVQTGTWTISWRQYTWKHKR